jgi:dipeptidyl aminopeptidase/acylaminoacyl peptidase
MSLPRRIFAATLIAAAAARAQQPEPFTLQQILSAPYSTSLTAAPVGSLFAWVETTQGRHNLFIAGPNHPVQQLTHNAEDDAQDITQLAWSPDATAIAYTYGAESGASGKPANPAHLQHPTPVQIILQPLTPNTKPTLIGEGHSPLFLPDNHTLLFLHDGKIWSHDLTSATATQLVYDRGSASQLTLSPDGTQLAYISRRTEEAQPSHAFLALYDLRTHTLTFPSPSTSNDSAPAFSPDSQSLAWLRDPFTQPPEFANPRTSPTPWSIQLLDLTTRLTRTLFTPEPNKPGSVLPHMSTGEPPLFFAADRTVFLSEADGWAHLYALDPRASSKPELLTPGNFEVEDPTIDVTTGTIYYASNETGDDPLNVDRRHIWRAKASGHAAIAVGATRFGIETHPQLSNGVLAALLSDDTYPMHPATWQDGVWTYLNPFDPGSSGFPDGRTAHPTRVLFSSTDGQHLHAQLFLPSKITPKTKHPAILFVHGGPNRQMLLGYPAMDYYSNAYAMNQYLTSRGFIVLSLNYRCGIGYGMDFRDCIHAGADGATEYNDVLAAAKYLRSRPDVDPSRIGIWGGSYGGYLTALALARNSDIFAAGVDFHGVHDWNLEDNAPDWRLDGRIGDAQHDAIRAKALASSPLADLSHWTSPILLIHGDDDPDVAYAQTPTLADALRARNGTLPPNAKLDMEELIFPDELHGFLLHKDWLAAYAAAAAFFERTLKP